MSPELESINVRKTNDVAIIDLKGDVTTLSEDTISDAFDSITKDGFNKILLNFQNVEYINSAGIAILIGMVTETRKNNQLLNIYGLSNHFEKIFKMVGLTRYTKIFNDENTALQSFLDNP